MIFIQGGEHLTNEELMRQYHARDESVSEKLYNKNVGFISNIAVEVAKLFSCSTVTASMKPIRNA